MNATATTTPVAELQALKSRLRDTWMTGNYDLFSRFMETDAKIFFERLDLPLETRLLDVGCGAGQLALIAARAGNDVTGCDIATNWLEKARERAEAEGLTVKFEAGDAESLPYDDSQFDAVVSMFGAMFAPQPDLVVGEMSRVCRKGGMIAMANWTPSGFIGQMFKVIAGHIAPTGMPSPLLWGDETTVRARFGNFVSELKTTPTLYRFHYPFTPSVVVEFFRDNYGPMSRAFASLGEDQAEELRTELISLWSANNQATDNTTMVDAEYLEVIGVRS